MTQWEAPTGFEILEVERRKSEIKRRLEQEVELTLAREESKTRGEAKNGSSSARLLSNQSAVREGSSWYIEPGERSHTEAGGGERGKIAGLGAGGAGRVASADISEGADLKGSTTTTASEREKEVARLRALAAADAERKKKEQEQLIREAERPRVDERVHEEEQAKKAAAQAEAEAAVAEQQRLEGEREREKEMRQELDERKAAEAAAVAEAARKRQDEIDAAAAAEAEQKRRAEEERMEVRGSEHPQPRKNTSTF